jgi:hypothetical protein
MRLPYSISANDFRSLQPPFALRVGRSLAFKVFLIPCALITAPGIVLLFRSGPAFIVGALLIVLGGGGAALAYLFEKRSVKNRRAEYEYRIQTASESLHCRDSRVAEFDENGFTFSCNCGQVTRPWSELFRFSETDSAFFLATKDEGHVIPKAAFPTEGAVTEFRALLLDKIEQQGTVTARPIEFKYQNADYRHAIILHILAGGGWRRLARNLLTSGLAIFAIYIFWKPGTDGTFSDTFSWCLGWLVSSPLTYRTM